VKGQVQAQLCHCSLWDPLSPAANMKRLQGHSSRSKVVYLYEKQATQSRPHVNALDLKATYFSHRAIPNGGCLRDCPNPREEEEGVAKRREKFWKVQSK